MVIGASAVEHSARAEVGASLREATLAMAIKGTPARQSVATLTNIVLRSFFMARLEIGRPPRAGDLAFWNGRGSLDTEIARGSGARSTRFFAGNGRRRRPGPDRPGRSLWRSPARGRPARMGTVRFRHGDFVSNAVFASQGRLVVSVSDGANTGRVGGSSVRVWDADTGRKLREIGDSATRFVSIALSPDGRTLATVEEPNRLRLWDFATGRELRRWHEVANQFYTHLAFSPDGQTVAAGVYSFDKAHKQAEKFINAWDTAAGIEARDDSEVTGWLYWT